MSHVRPLGPDISYPIQQYNLAVPIPINFRKAEIGTALTAINQKKIKVRAEMSPQKVRTKRTFFRPVSQSGHAWTRGKVGCIGLSESAYI